MGKRAGFGVVLIGAILAGSLGPRLTWPSSAAANAPFVYTPPSGFVPAEGDAWKAVQQASPAIRQAWYVIGEGAAVETSRPTVNVLHAPQTDPVEVSDLEALAAGMPDILARTNSSWRTVRVTREIRRDGARVGWVEGDCEKAGLKYHSVELVFPDDEGTSFVTAIVPSDQMDKWSPLFEASIQTATGVARRFGPPPPWMHLAWAAGGALLALLAGGIVQRRERRHQSMPAPSLPETTPVSIPAVIPVTPIANVAAIATGATEAAAAAGERSPDMPDVMANARPAYASTDAAEATET